MHYATTAQILSNGKQKASIGILQIVAAAFVPTLFHIQTDVNFKKSENLINTRNVRSDCSGREREV
jgi:uncharacterized protein (UPF0254 family)